MTKNAILSRLIKIGNSQGVRLPKTWLEASGITGKIEILLEKGQIIIRPVLETSRQGWAESFQEMANNQDDKLLDEETATDWDNQEWEW
jgi:antitoxin MazE